MTIGRMGLLDSQPCYSLGTEIRHSDPRTYEPYGHAPLILALLGLPAHELVNAHNHCEERRRGRCLPRLLG